MLGDPAGSASNQRLRGERWLVAGLAGWLNKPPGSNMWTRFLAKPLIWYLVGGLVFFLLVLGFFLWPSIRLIVWHQNLLQPFVKDAQNSLGGTSPQAAYQQFWQALQNNQRETALSYIIGLRRDYYQQVWQDQARWQLDQSLPEQTTLLFQGDCLPEAIACHQRAVLSYPASSSLSGQIELYQNLADLWQIGDIY